MAAAPQNFCKHLNTRVTLPNTSALCRIKRANDSAVETCSVGPAECTPAHAHTHTRKSPPKALANYYHHRRSEDLPTANSFDSHDAHMQTKAPNIADGVSAALLETTLTSRLFCFSVSVTTFSSFFSRRVLSEEHQELAFKAYSRDCCCRCWYGSG